MACPEDGRFVERASDDRERERGIVCRREPAGQRELADPRVQQTIRSQLHDRREQLLKAAYYEVLRDSAKVENYYAKKVLDSNGLEK